VVWNGADSRDIREQWSLKDIVPMVREHFGIEALDFTPNI